MRGEQTSPPPTLAATAETERLAGWGGGEAEVQANLEDQFEAEIACWRERQEREARETDGEAAEKVLCTSAALHAAPCTVCACNLHPLRVRRKAEEVHLELALTLTLTLTSI